MDKASPIAKFASRATAFGGRPRKGRRGHTYAQDQVAVRPHPGGPPPFARHCRLGRHPRFAVRTGRGRRTYTPTRCSARSRRLTSGWISVAHAAGLELLLDHGNSSAAASVAAELLTGISSGIDVGIAAVEADSSDSPSELASVGAISKGWNELRRLERAERCCRVLRRRRLAE